MYIHLCCEIRTGHTKYKIQKRSAKGSIEYAVYGLVAENSDE